MRGLQDLVDDIVDYVNDALGIKAKAKIVKLSKADDIERRKILMKLAGEESGEMT